MPDEPAPVSGRGVRSELREKAEDWNRRFLVLKSKTQELLAFYL